MIHRAAALIWTLMASLATAEPAAPVLSPTVGLLEIGIFCTPTEMGEAPAPGTLSGKVHVPIDDIFFDWPDRQTVPAEIGLAFGVRAQLAPGNAVPFGEVRVYLPGRAKPEIWGSSFTDLGKTFSFFSFDREEELIPGIWRFEAWDDVNRLYLVEFEVVPAVSEPGITGACGAVS